MKIPISLFLLIHLFLPILLFAQDSSAVFEKSKKMLSHPLSSFKKLINYDSVKYKIQGDPIIGNTYYTYKKDSVRSIFEGTVVSIVNIQDEYGIITKYGNYFIMYFGLKRPFVKNGEVIERNRLLGILAMTEDMDFQLELLVSTSGRYMDPMKWIK